MSATPQIRTALLGNLKELHLPAMREAFATAADQARRRRMNGLLWMRGISRETSW